MIKVILFFIIVIFSFNLDAQLTTIPTFRKEFTGIIERHYNELKFGGNYLEAEIVNYYLLLPEDNVNEKQSYIANNVFIDYYFSLPDIISVGIDVSAEYWNGDLIKSTNLAARTLGKTNFWDVEFNNIDIVIPFLSPYIKFVRIGKQWLNYSSFSLARVWGPKGVMIDGYIFPFLHYNGFYTWNKNSKIYTPSSYINLSYYYDNSDDNGRIYGGKIDYIFTGFGGLSFLAGAKISFIGVDYNSMRSNIILREEKTGEIRFNYSFYIFDIDLRYINRYHNEYFEDDGLGNISTNMYVDTAREYKVKMNNLNIFDYVIFSYRRIGANFVPWNPKKWLRYPPFFTRDYLNDNPDRPLYTDEEAYILYAHKSINSFIFNIRWDEGWNLSGKPSRYEFLWGNGITKRNMFIFEVAYYFLKSSFIYQYKRENYFREKTDIYIKENTVIEYNTFRVVINLLDNIKFNIGAVLQEGFLLPNLKIWDMVNRTFLIRKFITLQWMITKKIELRFAASFMNPNPPNLYTNYSGWREGPNFIMENKEWYGDFSDNFIRVGVFTKF